MTRKPKSASYEQRILNHIAPLEERGIGVTCRTIGKSMSAQRGLIREAAGYDGLWWHRHLPPFWIRRHVAKLTCPMVFDYDDPLIVSSRRGGRVSVTRRLRFAGMLRRADAGFAASAYLRELGEPYCKRIIIQPMAVDMPATVPVRDAGKKPVELMWIGQLPTQVYLEQIRGVLERLGSLRCGVRLRLVAHRAMAFGSLDVDYRPWSREEQDAALNECDIGLCPMPDSPWTRGKCPYKVLQYMAHAMPWVGSAVGENLNTSGDRAGGGTRGLCAGSESQWFEALVELIEDGALRRLMGRFGREYIEREHDRVVVVDRLAESWREVVGT